MQSHYRINVSQKGNHLFNTGDTIVTKQHAQAVFSLFKMSFPEKESYKIDCTYWETKGYPVNLS